MSDTGREPVRAEAPVAVSTTKKPSRVTRSRVRRVLSHRRRHLPLWFELPLLLLVAFCAAVLLRTFVIQSFDIPSESMEKTLLVGDRVLVNKMTYNLREPQRGEVVVFKGTERWSSELTQKPEKGFFNDAKRAVGNLVGFASPNEKDLIKRIIGTPGDKVKCCDNKNRVSVNGTRLDESSYVHGEPARGRYDGKCTYWDFPEVTVPEGHVFVMGDNRSNSRDSRCQGMVPIENFIGRAVNIVWPKSSWAALRFPDSFDDVPEPEGDPPPATSQGGSDVAATLPLLPLGVTLRNRKSPIEAVTLPVLCVHSFRD